MVSRRTRERSGASLPHHWVSGATIKVVVFHLRFRSHLYYTSNVAPQ